MLLIKNGNIVTMSGKNYKKGCVLIKDGKIEDVGEEIRVSENVSIIDAKGGWVLPGFIDSHCHIGMVEENIGIEGMDLNEITDPITPHLRAIDAINPFDSAFSSAVKAGITTVMSGPGSANVIGGMFVVMKTVGSCIDSMIIKEPAAIKVAFGENPKRIYKSKNKMPWTRMANAALLRETLLKAKNYKNKKETAEEKGEYFEVDLKMEALIPVLKKEIPLKAHAHRADDILTALRIAKEFSVNITLDHCTEGHLIADYIKDSGVPALIGPTMSWKGKVETKNKSFDTPYILNKKGVKTSIITDHPAVSIEYLPICAALAAKAGLGIEEALKNITINAAEILGVENRIGSIERGKDADIAIYDGNPLEVFTNTLYTIIDGKVVFKYNNDI